MAIASFEMVRIIFAFVVGGISVLMGRSLTIAQELPAYMPYSATKVLGTIDADEVEDCIVQAFCDPYPSLNDFPKSKEYRWRVRVPSGTNFNVGWVHGELPHEKIPKTGLRLFPKSQPLPKSSGDVVIVIRVTGEPVSSFQIAVFGEFPPKNTAAFDLKDPAGKEIRVRPVPEDALFLQGANIKNADWLPYWKEVEPKLENLDRESENRLTPEGKHLLMKHYVELDGKQEGYAIWLEFKE